VVVLARGIPQRQLSLIAGMGVGLLVMAASLLTELPSQGIGYAIAYGSQNADTWWPSWLVTSVRWVLSAGLIAGLVAGLLAAWRLVRWDTGASQVGSRSQVKPTDHIMPTVQVSPGHRDCGIGDDQGEWTGLHHQLRCGDVAAAMPKLVDDHIGYGGAPAHLACPSGQQDGVDVEQVG
jgi:hypothetical protein